MPPTSFRQPRARRIGELALAGTVALSVLVAAPRLLGDHPIAAADASASISASTGLRDVAQTSTELVDHTSPYDEHFLHTRLAADPTYRAKLTVAAATPEERAALVALATPAPPAPEPAPAVAPTPAPAPAPAMAAPAVSGGSVWDRVATCESHNNWSTHTANGFSGGLQFADGTWRSFGGTAYAPHAWQASREAQIAVAERVLASSGWNAWPACSRKLGLR